MQIIYIYIFADYFLIKILFIIFNFKIYYLFFWKLIFFFTNYNFYFFLNIFFSKTE